jgi:hypothetical protein
LSCAMKSSNVVFRFVRRKCIAFVSRCTVSQTADCRGCAFLSQPCAEEPPLSPMRSSAPSAREARRLPAAAKRAS